MIGGRRVGGDAPVLVIAEIGVNHNGNPALARSLVEAAADAGADAVKVQSFSAERVAGARAPKAAYQLETTDTRESQLAMLRRLELPTGEEAALAARCSELGLMFLSTPFDPASADALEAVEVPAYKVGSGDLTNHPLLAYVAAKRRPVLLSTGMADLAEVSDAAAVVRGAGAPLVLLHCVSSYPADPAEANLRAIPAIAHALDTPVGWSDHTSGLSTALAAVALGACVVERHLTLDRTLPGPDHAASSEPAEFGALVAAIRAVESALGDGVKRPADSERENRRLVRRSLVAARDLPVGTVLEEAMLDALRPGTGIAPSAWREVVGRRLGRDLAAHEPLAWDDLR